MLSRRDLLFPDVPIVFCGFNNYSPAVTVLLVLLFLIAGRAFNIRKHHRVEKELSNLNQTLEEKVAQRTAELENREAEIVTNLTAIAESEKKLLRSENRFRQMMESMSDPVYIGSRDYLIEYMNPAMIKRVGRDATGEFCFKALHDFERKCPWCKGKGLAQGEYFETEIVSPKDKHSYHLSCSPIFNDSGSISDMIIFRDTTEVKKLETQLCKRRN